jgi:hypothetical protein
MSSPSWTYGRPKYMARMSWTFWPGDTIWPDYDQSQLSTQFGGRDRRIRSANPLDNWRLLRRYYLLDYRPVTAQRVAGDHFHPKLQTSFAK